MSVEPSAADLEKLIVDRMITRYDLELDGGWAAVIAFEDIGRRIWKRKDAGWFWHWTLAKGKVAIKSLDRSRVFATYEDAEQAMLKEAQTQIMREKAVPPRGDDGGE